MSYHHSRAFRKGANTLLCIERLTAIRVGLADADEVIWLSLLILQNLHYQDFPAEIIDIFSAFVDLRASNNIQHLGHFYGNSARTRG
jgi:hypothetical protein